MSQCYRCGGNKVILCAVPGKGKQKDIATMTCPDCQGAGKFEHGGKRVGAGRPLKTERCTCGKHTVARAEGSRLKCRLDAGPGSIIVSGKVELV